MESVSAYKYITCINTGDLAHEYPAFIPEVYIPWSVQLEESLGPLYLNPYQDPYLLLNTSTDSDDKSVIVNKDNTNQESGVVQRLNKADDTHHNRNRAGIIFNMGGGFLREIFCCSTPRNFTSYELKLDPDAKLPDRTSLYPIKLPFSLVKQLYDYIEAQRQTNLIKIGVAKSLEQLQSDKSIGLDDLIVEYRIQEIRKGGDHSGSGRYLNGFNSPCVARHPLGDGKRCLLMYPDGSDEIISDEEYEEKFNTYQAYYLANRDRLDPIINQRYIEKIHQGQVYQYTCYGPIVNGDYIIKSYLLPDGIHSLVRFFDQNHKFQSEQMIPTDKIKGIILTG